MDFRKRLYDFYIYRLLVWKLLSLCLWHVFNSNLHRMCQIGVELLYVVEALYKQVGLGSIDPSGIWRINGKNFTNCLSIFFCYLFGVRNNQNK